MPKPVHMFDPATISSARAWQALFLHPAVQDLLERYKSSPPDALTLAQNLRTHFDPAASQQIGAWLQLQPKAQQKFGPRQWWLCDAFAYEQSTGAELSQWKTQLWPAGINLADLCCGMGGDSMFLPANIRVLGVDLDPRRVAMFVHNTAGRAGNSAGILGDALSEAWRADYLQIDPARRVHQAQNQRKILLEPSWEQVTRLFDRVAGAMVKLPPAFPLEMLPPTASVLYLGQRNDCLETLVLWGEFPWVQNLGLGPVVGAVNVTDGQFYAQPRSAVVNLPVQPVQKWIYEPLPTMVRSHLFTNLAQKLDLSLIDEQIAYLTADFKVESPWFRAFEVLEQGSQNRKGIQQWIYAHNIGKLTIKKRGVDMDIDQELKKFKLKGDNNGILFYTRAQEKRLAILTKPQEIW